MKTSISRDFSWNIFQTQKGLQEMFIKFVLLSIAGVGGRWVQGEREREHKGVKRWWKGS